MKTQGYGAVFLCLLVWGCIPLLAACAAPSHTSVQPPHHFPLDDEYVWKSADEVFFTRDGDDVNDLIRQRSFDLNIHTGKTRLDVPLTRQFRSADPRGSWVISPNRKWLLCVGFGPSDGNIAGPQTYEMFSLKSHHRYPGTDLG